VEKLANVAWTGQEVAATIAIPMTRPARTQWGSAICGSTQDAYQLFGPEVRFARADALIAVRSNFAVDRAEDAFIVRFLCLSLPRLENLLGQSIKGMVSQVFGRVVEAKDAYLDNLCDGDRASLARAPGLLASDSL